MSRFVDWQGYAMLALGAVLVLISTLLPYQTSAARPSSNMSKLRLNEFMKGSVWMWNGWREVRFNKDGSFYAPESNCQESLCTWEVDGGGAVRINWRRAGLHVVKPNRARSEMKGTRQIDRSRVSATYVRHERPVVAPDAWKDPEHEDYDPYVWDR